jgi:deoxycytidylate deaminase
MPCVECARAIIQAGISEVIVSAERMSRYQSVKYSEQHALAELMLKEAGVSVRGA